MSRGKAKEAILASISVLRIGDQIYMSKMGELIRLILEETYYTHYSIH